MRNIWIFETKIVGFAIRFQCWILGAKIQIHLVSKWTHILFGSTKKPDLKWLQNRINNSRFLHNFSWWRWAINNTSAKFIYIVCLGGRPYFLFNISKTSENVTQCVSYFRLNKVSLHATYKKTLNERLRQSNSLILRFHS